jgi:hypothetical protein
LDAQNAGNDISGIQVSTIFWRSTLPDPPFMRGILATHVAFSHCYPPLIYYLTERSLFKKCPPPHGKTLKKALFHRGVPGVPGGVPGMLKKGLGICGMLCIGKIERSLKIRFGEHRRACSQWQCC